MRQELVPLLLHKGQLHNWQVRNSVQSQNLGVSASKTRWCLHLATQGRKTLLSSYFSCKQEQIVSEKSFLDMLVTGIILF